MGKIISIYRIFRAIYEPIYKIRKTLCIYLRILIPLPSQTKQYLPLSSKWQRIMAKVMRYARRRVLNNLDISHN